MGTHAIGVDVKSCDRPYETIPSYAHHSFVAHDFHTSNGWNVSYNSSNCGVVSVVHFWNCNWCGGQRLSKLVILCADNFGASALPKDVVSDNEVSHVGADVPESNMRHMFIVTCTTTC